MEQVLLDDVVDTDYGQFDLVWSDDGGFDGDFDRFFDGQVNGLVGAADPGGVYLNLARRSGGSRVRIVLRDAQPALPPDRYEDAVEVSMVVPDGAAVHWEAWAGDPSGPLAGIAPGSYRLRVSAHGRDAGQEVEFVDGEVDDEVDDYLLELWPAAHAGDAVLRVGSDDARYWHRENGGRR